MALYEIAVLGCPSEEQLGSLRSGLESAVDSYGLSLGEDIILHVTPGRFDPSLGTAAVAVFFGGSESVKLKLADVMDIRQIPVVPIATSAKLVASEIPAELGSLNCLLYDKDGAGAVVPALLGCVGLLPRQRRVFLSYRRDSATPAAVQLFSEFSARKFDVFLDTHSIGVAEEFQEELWHQLCDVDVLVMLETNDYFGSRWTMAEYGRALSKGIGVLRVEWPDSTPSIYTGTASRAELISEEIDAAGMLSATAVERICRQLEQVRVTSHAVRHLSVVSAVTNAIERIAGHVVRIGANRSIYLKLPSGRQLVVQPTIGVPTSVTLEEAIVRAEGSDAAVVYDHLGIKPGWQNHLSWLAKSVTGARWVKVTDAAWDFAGWEV